MTDRVLKFFAAAAFFVPAVLLLDGGGSMRQLSLCVATVLFLVLFVRTAGVDVRAVVAAVVVATAGELVLSVAWGLYEYREALLPLYVPPGHGLFYAFAAAAAKIPALVRRETTIVRSVFAIGSLGALASLIVANDVWGAIWWAAAATMLFRSKRRLLLAACFVNATLLEWAGTLLGNWRWAPVVPGLGLTSGNPPSGVGVLYVVLDLIVVALVARTIRSAPEPASALASSEAV